eukprot:jgi/Bigna1/68192/fgenesh1_pg.5_\
MAGKRMLRIFIHSANDLPAGDKSGLSDPYVNVVIKEKDGKESKLKTKTIKKTLDPEWDEKFEVLCPSGLDSILFSVVDNDVLGKDEELGWVKLEQRKANLSRWPTTTDLKLRQGTLRVTLALASTDDWIWKPYVGTLKLTIVEASGLRDTNLVTRQNPIVYAKYKDVELKTSVCKGGHKTPKWNETLEFKIDNPPGDTEEIQVVIKDKETLKEDFLGEVILPLPLLITNKKRWWRVFQNMKKNQVEGQLHLIASFEGKGGYPTKKEDNSNSRHGIIKAEYGVPRDRMINVTSVLSHERLIQKGKLILPRNLDLDFAFGCDPHPTIPTAERKEEIDNNPKRIEHVLTEDYEIKNLKAENIISGISKALKEHSNGGSEDSGMLWIIAIVILAIYLKLFYI